MARSTNNHPARRRDEPKVFRLVGGRVTDTAVAGPPPAAAQSPETAAPREEQIRLLAYGQWEAAGSPPGDGVEFWLAAERELAGR